jgi:hypothetical protein
MARETPVVSRWNPFTPSHPHFERNPSVLVREMGLGWRSQVDSGSAECYARDNLAKPLREFELVLLQVC